MRDKARRKITVTREIMSGWESTWNAKDWCPAAIAIKQKLRPGCSVSVDLSEIVISNAGLTQTLDPGVIRTEGTWDGRGYSLGGQVVDYMHEVSRAKREGRAVDFPPYSFHMSIFKVFLS